jgi:hypothetical protein
MESDCELRRMEDSSFRRCLLKSLCLPKNVEFIGDRAFVGSPIESIIVDCDNCHFSICSDFLVDVSESKSIQNVGLNEEVFVGKSIKSLRK